MAIANWEAYHEVVLVRRTPQVSSAPTLDLIAPILPAGPLYYSREVSADGQIAVSQGVEQIHPSVSSLLIDMENNPLELWVYRGTDLVQAGPLISWQVQNETITYQARGLLYYTRYMYIWPNTIRYRKFTDQFTIVKDIIDQWQDQNYGNFGLDTSSIGTSGITRKPTYSAQDLNSVSDVMAELGNNDVGFDYFVNPSTREVELYYPRMGTDKSDSVILGGLHREVPSVAYSLAARTFGNIALQTGSWHKSTQGTFVYRGEQSDSTKIVNFGRAAVADSSAELRRPSDVNDYATALLEKHNQPHWTFSNEFIVSSGGFIEDYDAGDTVTIDIDLGFENVIVEVDILTKGVRVDTAGREQVLLVTSSPTEVVIG